MATIVDGKMRSGELKDNDQVVVNARDALTENEFDNVPTEGSNKLLTSGAVYDALQNAIEPSDYAQVKEQVQQNTQNITSINEKIPAQASAQNQLADKAFVNSSIQTNTATFRGTYNLVTDLELTVSATDEQTAAAIATHLASLVPPVVPENNDYVFVQVPRATEDPADFDPTVIARVDRYKCSVTESGGVTTRVWQYEWSLNNSSFTAAQWAAINSGITSGDVAKIQLIDALVARGYIGFQNGGNKVLAISGEQLTVYKTVSRRTTTPATTYPNKIGFKFNLKEFVAYCLSAADDPIGKSTIDQVQLNGSAILQLYFPTTTTADFVRIGVYTSSTATTPVSVSEAQLIGSLGTITEYTFDFSSQSYLTADATYYFRIEDDSGTAIPCYIYASDKFTGFSWAFINSDGTAGSDISSTMPDLQLGCNIKTYYTIELEARDLVALENFSQQKTYAQGERVIYNNDLYEVKAGGHAAGAWNSSHFKKLFSIDSNITMGDAKVEKRATSSLWPSPSGNIVAGQNGATASGENNIVLGYGAEARNRNASSLTDTTMNNIALGNAARIINDLLASARKPTTDTTAVADAVYFGYGAKYSSAATYANQSYCSYGYGIYQCTSAISSPEVWNPAHWSLKDALDYDATKTYAVGDVCKHSGSLYTCSTAIDAPKDWDVDDWTYVSLGEFQEGAMVSLTTSAGSTLPQNDYLQIYIAPAGYLTGISRAILLGAFSVIRASGGIGIGNDLTVNDPDATVIGNGATSHGAKSLNFAATELIKVFLGDANLVDLINQAVADQLIKAAVSAEVTQTRSTPTATRKLLALNPADPTGEKTEVTAQDVGAATPSDIPEVIDPANATAAGSAADALAVKTALAGKLGNSGNQTLNGSLASTGQTVSNPSDSNREARMAKIGLVPAGTPRKGQGKLGYVLGLEDGTDRECSLYIDDDGKVYINTPSGYVEVPNATAGGTLALLADMYAAVQQIAPAWVSGTTYAETALVSYNGVVYARKTSGYITSSTNPASDTTNWKSKKVSELFIGNRGDQLLNGTMVLQGASASSSNGLDITRLVGASYRGWRFYQDSNLGLTIQLGGAWNHIVFRRRASDSTSDTVSYLYDIAPEFKTTDTYKVGALVVRTEFLQGESNEYYYSAKLYRCVTEHTGAWEPLDFTEATVQDVLALLAPLASPAFTGTPTAPNLTNQSADGQVANKKYVDDSIDAISVTPLSGQTFDFATMQGIFAGVKACIEALGGSVTNFPTIPVNE